MGSLPRGLDYQDDPLNQGTVVGRGTAFARLKKPLYIPKDTERLKILNYCEAVIDTKGQLNLETSEFTPNKFDQASNFCLNILMSLTGTIKTPLREGTEIKDEVGEFVIVSDRCELSTRFRGLGGGGQ